MHIHLGKRSGIKLLPTPATPVNGSTKYGNCTNTTLSINHMALPAAVIADLENAARHSLAIKTWSSYRTAERALTWFCREEKIVFDLPIKENTLLLFVHWLVFKKGKKSSTVNSYLAGIRKLHVMKGMAAPTLRTDLVKMVLAGRKNIEDAQRLREGGKERQPVTPAILELIKARLKEWQADATDKCTVWTVATLLFHGAFRGGELLSRSRLEFDPAFVLLRRDIVISPDSEYKGQETVQVKVKAPKERRDNRSVIVDIYQADTAICPVRATKKWWRATKHFQSDQPAFRLVNGDPLTIQMFNKIVKDRLTGFLDNYYISSHSFRGGAPSMMANLGYSDKDVKAVGRWSSRAVELYMKLPRTKRIAAAKKVQRFGLTPK